jgi:hypothetical protein
MDVGLYYKIFRCGDAFQKADIKMEIISYFYQSSKHLSEARLDILRGGRMEFVDIFGFLNRFDFDYRCVLIIECVDSLLESSRKYIKGNPVYYRNYEVDLQADIAFSNLTADVDLPLTVKRGGSFDLHVSASRYVPLVGMNCTSEEYEKRGVAYSEIIFIHLTFCKRKSVATPSLEASQFIYESYDQLGFVGMDEALFNNFIVERLGRGKHDLLHSFTTTEIANELFHAGLMILCWGITPWVYMINSLDSDEVSLSFTAGLPVCQSGSYVFQEKIKEISIVPGTALKGWDTESQGTWPKLKLNGAGGVVQVDLCVAKAINPYDTSVPDCLPMPFFNLNRIDVALAESVPILSADIESCMS